MSEQHKSSQQPSEIQERLDGPEIVGHALETIRETETLIADELGAQGEELTAITDEALISVADQTIEAADKDGVRADDETNEIQQAVGAVIVEGTMEEVGIKKTSGENPIAEISASHEPEFVDTIEDLRDHNALLPTGENIPAVAVGLVEKLKKEIAQRKALRKISKMNGYTFYNYCLTGSEDDIDFSDPRVINTYLKQDLSSGTIGHLYKKGVPLENLEAYLFSDQKISQQVIDRLANEINTGLENNAVSLGYSFMDHMPVEVMSEMMKRSNLKDAFVDKVNIQAYGEAVFRAASEGNSFQGNFTDQESIDFESGQQMKAQVALLKELGFTPFSRESDVPLVFGNAQCLNRKQWQKNLIEVMGGIPPQFVDKMYNYKFTKLMQYAQGEDDTRPKLPISHNLQPSTDGEMADYYHDRSSEEHDSMDEIFDLLVMQKGMLNRYHAEHIFTPSTIEHFFKDDKPNAALEWFRNYAEQNDYQTHSADVDFYNNYSEYTRFVVDVVDKPVSPQTTFENFMEYRRLPQGDAARLYRTRQDAITLERIGHVWRDHSFIHENYAGMHEILANTLKVYDAKNEDQRIKCEKELRAVLDKYGYAGEVGLDIDWLLENGDTPLPQDFSGQSETSIDVLRRLVEDTKPREFKKPKVLSNKELDSMIQNLKVHELSDGRTVVEFKAITGIIGKINEILEQSQGQTGFDPSIFEAMSYAERLAGFAVADLSQKDILEMPYDPGFAELLKFRELALGGEQHNYDIGRLDGEFGNEDYLNKLKEYYAKITKDISLDWARLVASDKQKNSYYHKSRKAILSRGESEGVKVSSQLYYQYISGLNNALMRLSDRI
jgi:hypothetical protein